ncbi:hypothetical protein GCM10010103_54930 [Streptomyces paradoxus]|uniref:Uncharacterized protein n=1 Tax=Streptomyces paradoxus TaxID=66375 RepID=A0A7W9TI96_9ACTN|nr:hypothetical protein [Streptomyces paradoxus]
MAGVHARHLARALAERAGQGQAGEQPGAQGGQTRPQAAGGSRTGPRTNAQFSRAADSSSTCAGVAPFCGPKTRATPRSPHSTLYGLQATSSSTSVSRGSRPVGSMR